MIDTNEISISLSGAETVALMHAIVVRMEQIQDMTEEAYALHAIVEKLGPQIMRKLEQGAHQLRDGLN